MNDTLKYRERTSKAPRKLVKAMSQWIILIFLLYNYVLYQMYLISR